MLRRDESLAMIEEVCLQCARPGLVLLAAVLVGGCASVSIDEHELLGPRPGRGVPDLIHVQAFEVPPGVIRADRSGENLEEFTVELGRDLRDEIVDRSGKHLARSVPAPKRVYPPSGRAWLIAGRFTRVNQGSRALRMLLGFGAGGSKVETEVFVYDLSGPNPVRFMRFITTGGSGAMPGAIANIDVFGAAMSAVGNSFSGVTFDTVRTSREIVAVLSDHLAREGFIEPDEALQPKRAGSWP